ncbi:MAG: hypothetical protein LAT78_02800 [Roseinatronobacter sp.]|jgi:hypothetical protein|nr:hypothetical protein [Roseinatronobacter sp.]
MILVLGILAVIAALLVWRPWERRSCRWREDRRKLADGRVLFVCMACGADMALPKGRSPKTCRAGDM